MKRGLEEGGKRWKKEKEREPGGEQSLTIIRQGLFFILKAEGTFLNIFNSEWHDKICILKLQGSGTKNAPFLLQNPKHVIL